MMNYKKIPTAKLQRTAITGLTTARVGLKHITHLSKKSFSSSRHNPKLKEKHEQEIGKILINTLMQLRGTALKVAQMMSLELDMLPAGIRSELSKACSQVTPLNRAHIRKAFIDEFAQSPETVFRHFDNSAFAAASLGQVHQATNTNSAALAVKIQYPGIGASIKSDVQLVRGMMKTLTVSTSFLPRYEIIDNILDQVQAQLEKEIDYIQEANNTRWFAKHLRVHSIKIPEVYTQYSGAKVLTTEYIEGLHVDQWLQNQPSQTLRNQYGQHLFDLFCFQLHELKILHADPHQGNFIFMDDGRLALIDYGCVHQLQNDYPNIVTRLFTRDSEQLHGTYCELGLINPEITFEQFDKEIMPYICAMVKWLTDPYQEDEYDFANMPPLPKQPISTMKYTAKHIHALHQDQMYFDRSYIGMLSMLRKLGAKVVTTGLLNPLT